MITENAKKKDYLEELHGIQYLISNMAETMTGDDVQYAKEALTFLSNSMYDTLNTLNLKIKE